MSTSSPFASAAFSAKPGLSAFGNAGAANPPITGLNSKPAKPFGAPESEDEGEDFEDGSGDEEDGEDDDEQSSAAKDEESKRDRRFHEQEGTSFVLTMG
jgi:Ran-binding protein 3